MLNVEEGRSSVTGPSPYIHLRVKGQNGNEEYFKMKRGAQLRKLMTAYCERRSLQFDDTLKMEDGDEIDAMLHQTGGVVAAS
ncbi:small ubiquitin-related modifier 1-like [Olea europaea subsp. europaea]|uniref:Small ubiquitin-related modifier 1-like n=1 Tax=Olea europaea subsp. europaea TaxID=158383 RepID=A0A8S0TY52_OLEEU|nr:small ubiquitin-related modifier 1-like [Olea europaea subsp. europaea]